MSIPLAQLFGRTLGTEVGHVRVHTGAESAEAARALGARAYTLGQDLHFGAGQYDPSSREGQHLIAHEVAHTVQQRGATPTRQHKLEVTSASDHAEVEADRFADAVTAGQPAAPLSARGPAIAREALSGANPADLTDGTGAATTTHRALGISDAGNAPKPAADAPTASRAANVKVIATEAAPLHMATPGQPDPNRVFQEGPAVSPAPAGFTPVTAIKGSVGAPIVEQTPAPGLYIANQPTADDVQQGGLGDCYFLSTLIEIATRDPGHIKSIMKPDGQGGATVTLWRDQARSGEASDPQKAKADFVPVTVPVSADFAVTVSDNRVHGARLRCAPAPSSQTYYAKLDGASLEVHRKDLFEVARWVPLLEKAYAQFAQQHGQYGGASAGNAAGGSGYDVMGRSSGGQAGRTLTVLYGAAGEASAAHLERSEIASSPGGGGGVVAENASVVDQLLPVAGRGPETAPTGGTVPIITVQAGHCYAVLSAAFLNAARQPVPLGTATGAARQAMLSQVDAHASTVVVRNPWHYETYLQDAGGSKPGQDSQLASTDGGVVKMTLDSFLQVFKYVISGAVPKT
ncbi:MAG TPA: DUF4157 domain-containing protein [Kofleriaceae bacterium]